MKRDVITNGLGLNFVFIAVKATSGVTDLSSHGLMDILELCF